MLFQTPDEELIHKALNGSQRSWVKLVSRYESQVYNYCLRMTGNAHDAMDLMQEVFLSIYRHLPSFRGQSSFKTWMFRITTNKSIDFLRARDRHPQQSLDQMPDQDVPGFAMCESGNPDQRYQQGDTNRQIQSLMSRLPAEQRLVVELKFFQHCTFEQIAAQINVPVNTVKSRLYSALQKLKTSTEVQHVM